MQKMKSERKKPDTRILQNRYFTVRDIREALRKLDLGIDNAEFKRLWDEEVISPPDIIEPQAVLWSYNHAVDLIKDIYKLKGMEDKFEIYDVDTALVHIKEIKRYRREMVSYANKGEPNPY